MRIRVSFLVFVILNVTSSAFSEDIWVATNGPGRGIVWSLAIDEQERIFALTDSGLCRSTDYGQLWTRLDVAAMGAYYSGGVVAVDQSGAVFVPDSAGMGVWHSTDHGDTWVHRAQDFWAPTDIVFHPSGSIFYKAGTGIYRSTNDGVGWDSVSSIPGKCLALDANGDIYTVADSCYRSTDNGDTWVGTGAIGLPPPDVISVEDVLITRSGNLIAATDEMGLYASTDGGVTWIRPGNPRVGGMGIHFHYPSLLIAPSGHVLLGCDPHGVFISADDGGTWSGHSDGLTDTVVYSLAISPSGYLYAGTYGGTVFRSILPTTDVVEPASGVPGVLSIAQNYPNPFNPLTTIEYTLPRAAHVTLTVFDVLGQQVEILLSGELPAGHHRALWNAAGRPSGVYFYQIRTGNSVATRRMMLLK